MKETLLLILSWILLGQGTDVSQPSHPKLRGRQPSVRRKQSSHKSGSTKSSFFQGFDAKKELEHLNKISEMRLKDNYTMIEKLCTDTRVIACHEIDKRILPYQKEALDFAFGAFSVVAAVDAQESGKINIGCFSDLSGCTQDEFGQAAHFILKVPADAHTQHIARDLARQYFVLFKSKQTIRPFALVYDTNAMVREANAKKGEKKQPPQYILSEMFRGYVTLGALPRTLETLQWEPHYIDRAKSRVDYIYGALALLMNLAGIHHGDYHYNNVMVKLDVFDKASPESYLHLDFSHLKIIDTDAAVHHTSPAIIKNFRKSLHDSRQLLRPDALLIHNRVKKHEDRWGHSSAELDELQDACNYDIHCDLTKQRHILKDSLETLWKIKEKHLEGLEDVKDLLSATCYNGPPPPSNKSVSKKSPTSNKQRQRPSRPTRTR